MFLVYAIYCGFVSFTPFYPPCWKHRNTPLAVLVTLLSLALVQSKKSTHVSGYAHD